MKNFYQLWFGHIISLFGSGLASFAVGVWVYEQTGSAVQFALIAFFAVLPSVVLSPLAGILVDRWDRRWVMILGHLGALFGPLAILGLLSAERLETWHLYLIISWITTFSTVQSPSFAAAVPLLVPKDQLGRASGMIELGPALSRTLAPFLAGTLVVTIGLPGVLWIDVATILIAIVAVFFTRLPAPLETEGEKRAGAATETNAMGELTAGWRYLREHAGLLWLLVVFALFNFGLGMVQVLLAPMVLSFGTAVTLGIIQSTAGMGMLLGGGVMSVWGGPRRRVPTLLALLMFQGLVISLVGIRADTILISAAAFVVLFCSPLIHGTNRVLFQVKVPPELRGRVFSVRTVIMLSSAPLAYLMAGPLAEHVFEPLLMPGGRLAASVGSVIGTGEGRGIGLLIGLVGLGISLTAAAALLWPRLRRLEDEISDAVEPKAVRGPADGPSERASAGPTAGPVPARADAASRGGALDDLRQDVRFGSRALLKHPAFALVVVFTLGLGLGAVTSIFTVATSVLFQRLPFAEPQRLVVFSSLRLQDGNLQFMPVSYPDYRDWRDQSGEVFEGLAVYGGQSFNLGVGDELRHVAGELVSANYFSVLGVDPLLGRVFTAGEDQEGRGSQVAVLSSGLWQSLFPEAQAPGDQTVLLNGRTYEVIGVMPPIFQGMTDESQVWIPVTMAPLLRSPEFIEQRRFRWLAGVGRLTPGVSLLASRRAMDNISVGMAQSYPETNKDVVMGIRLLTAIWLGNQKTAIFALSIGAFFVLLIASFNVANILLARALARRREMAMRKALGAGFGRLVRQLLTESLILAFVGGLCGLLVAHLTTRALMSMNAVRFASFVDIGMNPLTLGLVVTATIASGLIFGLAPVLVVSRTPLSAAMKEGSQGSGRGGRRRFQSTLVVIEIALALALLVGAGLMIRSFRNLQSFPLGFEPRDLLTVSLDVKDPKYDSPAALGALARDLEARLAALPGVTSAALASPSLPAGTRLLRDFAFEGTDLAEDENKITIEVHHVSPGYWKTLGVEPVSGRFIDARDTRDSAPVVVVGAELARRYWPDEDPIGKGLRLFTAAEDDPWFRVVGVAPEIRHRGYRLDPLDAPHLYFALFQEPPRPTTVLKCMIRGADGRGTGELATLLRGGLRAAVPDLPPYDLETMVERLEAHLTNPRFLVLLAGLFAFLALVLAAVGVYGMVSYSVTQERREIAVRMAIGAQRGDVLRRLLLWALKLAVFGIALGGLAAFALVGTIKSLLIDVESTDPWTFGATAGVLLLVAVAASLIPAWRAARVDPVTELRGE